MPAIVRRVQGALPQQGTLPKIGASVAGMARSGRGRRIVDRTTATDSSTYTGLIS